MDDRQQSISITILRRAREEKAAQRRALDAEIEDLDHAIRRLQGEEGTGSCVIDSQSAAAIVEGIENAVEDDEQYPAEMFKGMTRIEMAITLANEFDGFLATSALRKILSKPGVLKSISQVGSVASRVLANSDEFERVWEGLYRLKQGEEGVAPSVEE